MSGPSNLEQFYLELINEARIDPMGSAARYISSYTPLKVSDEDVLFALTYFGVSGSALLAAFQSLVPVAPVAWNDSLANASRQHDQAMINADTQSHQLPGEPAFAQRDEAAGYTGWTRLGEIVYAFAESPVYALAGFMVDWGVGPDGMQNPAGHRLAIMNAAFTEIGIGVLLDNNPDTSVGPQVVTGDLGARGHRFALGVAYTDSDSNDFYTPGEGRADLVVTANGVTVTSTASGGYALDLGTAALSNLTLTFTGAGLTLPASLTMSSFAANVKADIVNGNTLETTGSGVVSGFGTIQALGVRGVAITADAGSQTFISGPGNDTFNGGAGADTAVFSGNRSDYTISYSGSFGAAIVTVVDNRAGSPDGTDTFTSVERLRFADGTRVLHTAGDLNDDGTTDLLFQSRADGSLVQWLVNRSGGVTSDQYTTVPTNGLVAGFGNFNFSAMAEPLVRAPSKSGEGTLRYLAYTDNSPAGHGVPQTLVTPAAGLTFRAIGQFNSDRDSDVLFTNAAGSYSIWLQGYGTYQTIGSPGANWALKGTGDLDGDGQTDLVFQDTSGMYAVWKIDGGALSGGGAIGNPGAGWFYKGLGDFNGDGNADLLFQNANGHYAIWDMSGNVILGGGDIGTPGSDWTLAAIGDYNGDGNSDLLFRSASGELATWLMSNTTIIGGTDLGNPGANLTLQAGLAPAGFADLVFANASGALSSWTIGGGTIVASGALGNAGTGVTALAAADFFSTGETDILFKGADGTLAIWRTNGSSVVGTAVIGNPGAGWSAVAAADFNGDGRDDVLLHNAATGTYATWDLAGNAIVGGGMLGAAAGFSFVAAGDIDGDGHADIVFRNDATGSFAAWLMQDTAIVGGGAIGNPGGSFHFAGLGDFNGDGKADMLFEDAGGNFAEWSLNGTQIAGGGAIGNPGGTWEIAKIADVNQDGRDDIVFVDANGTYASWLMSGNTILGGAALGTVGSGYHLI